MSRNNAEKRIVLFNRQQGLCPYCDLPIFSPSQGTLEHIRPVSKGGGNGIGNLLIVHWPCNDLRKNFTSIAEAEEYIERLMNLLRKLKEKGYIS